jgi:hypothetical protein
MKSKGNLGAFNGRGTVRCGGNRPVQKPPRPPPTAQDSLLQNPRDRSFSFSSHFFKNA